MKSERAGIVVVGGGYAGVIAALRAWRGARGQMPVTLVSDREWLVERIRLHEVAASGFDANRPLSELLEGTDVRRICARVSRIEQGERRIETETGPIPFEALIVCVGSRVERRAVAGIEEHAFTLDAGEAERLHARVTTLPARARILVLGAGLTGVEAATELAQAHPRLEVLVLTRAEVGAQLGDPRRPRILAGMARLGVEVREHQQVVSIEAQCARLADRSVVPFDVCVWAGGFVAAPLLADSGFEVDGRGRALTDATLRVRGGAPIWIAGDCAAPRGAQGSELIMGCKTALPMGAHAADNVRRMLAGKPERPFGWRDAGYCLSLGRADGVISPLGADGAPTSWSVRGGIGAFVKERVNRYTIRSLHWERRGSFSYRWPKPAAARAQLPAQLEDSHR